MGAAECPLAESPLCRPWRGWASLYSPQGEMGSPEDSAGSNTADDPGTPVGKNTLSKMMKTICKKAGLETEYTNHCIRTTSITALHRAGTDVSL